MQTKQELGEEISPRITETCGPKYIHHKLLKYKTTISNATFERAIPKQ